MNLNVVRQQLESIDLEDLILLSGPDEKEARSDTETFRNLIKYRNAINHLEVTGIMADLVTSIKKSAIFMNNSDVISFSGDGIQTMKDRAFQLYIGVRAIYDILNEALPREEQNVMRIKLPDVDSFQEMSNVLNDFKKAISIPIMHKDIGGSLKILHGESGSVWIVIAIAGTAAMILIGDIVWSALLRNQNAREDKHVLDRVSEYGLDEIVFAEFVAKQDAHLINLLDGEAEGIAKRNSMQMDSEELTQIKVAIKTMGDLLEKGAQVLPGITASESVKKAFPTNTSGTLIESKIKRLQEGDSNS